MVGKIAGFTVVNLPALSNDLVRMGYRVMYRQYIPPQQTYQVDWLQSKNYEQAKNVGKLFYYNGPHRSEVVNIDKKAYIKIVNECAYHFMDYAFWIGMMEAADLDGRKLAIFGDSSGSPEVDQWKTRIPALRYAMSRGHVITLNQYGRTNPDKSDANYRVSDDEGYMYFGGRHERFYEAVPVDCRPPLIIGETGASNSRINQPFAVEDAIAYSKKLASRPFGDRVLFFSLYTLGWSDGEWAHLDSQIPLAETLLRTL